MARTKAGTKRGAAAAAAAAAEKPEKAWESRRVPASQLTFDDNLQMRVEPRDPGEYLAELEQAKEGNGKWPFPPIKCCEVKGKLLVVDGFTRGRAAVTFSEQNAVDMTVPVKVRKSTYKQAFAEALGSNASHGYRRTNADKRYAVQRALAEFVGASCERIALYCKVSPPFVYKMRAKLSNPEAEEPTPEQVAQAELEHKEAEQREKEARAQAARQRKEQKELGACPNCQNESTDAQPIAWTDTDGGWVCAKCLHPHGEPAGDAGEEPPAPAAAPEAPNRRGRSPKIKPEEQVPASQPEASAAQAPLDLRGEKLKKIATEFGALVRLLSEVELYSELVAPLNQVQQAILRERGKCQKQ